MVDKCSSPNSKTTVLDCLKPLTLRAVRNGDRMLRNKFFVVCKCPGRGTLSTAKCPAPETHLATNAQSLPGGGEWLATGIDSHIISSLCIQIVTKPYHLNKPPTVKY